VRKCLKIAVGEVSKIRIKQLLNPLFFTGALFDFSGNANAVTITLDFVTGNDDSIVSEVLFPDLGGIKITAGGYNANASSSGNNAGKNYFIKKDVSGSSPTGYGVCINLTCNNDVDDVDGSGDEAIFVTSTGGSQFSLTGLTFVDGDRDTIFSQDTYDILIDSQVAQAGFVDFDIPNGGVVTGLNYGPASMIGIGAAHGSTDNWYIANATLEAQPTPTPEPSTLLLFGFGLAGFGLFRRRRKAAQPPRVL